MFIFLFIMSMLIPLTMILIGIIWQFNPPANINGWYGYRTSMSMKNADTWNFAHRHCAKVWTIIGIVSLFPSGALMLIFRADYEMISIILTIVQCVLISVSAIPTSVAMHKVFDKNGIRKK